MFEMKRHEGSSQGNSLFVVPATWQLEDKVIRRKAQWRDSLSCLRTLQGLVQLKESFPVHYEAVILWAWTKTPQRSDREKGNDFVSLIAEPQSHCFMKLFRWGLYLNVFKEPRAVKLSAGETVKFTLITNHSTLMQFRLGQAFSLQHLNQNIALP